MLMKAVIEVAPPPARIDGQHGEREALAHNEGG